MKRNFPKQKILVALLITAFIFILVIVTNGLLNDSKINQLNSLYNDIRIDALNAEVQYEILSENPCLALNFKPLNDELFELGNKLTHMEEQLGKENDQVLDLKKYYSILESRHWLFVRKASEQCNQKTTPILFFYSNQGDCSDCEQQGFVLNYIRNTISGAYIYSFDINLESSAIEALEITYNITTVPTLVIGENTYVGFKDSDELEELIK